MSGPCDFAPAIFKIVKWIIGIIIVVAIFIMLILKTCGCSAEGDFFENIGCQDVGVTKAYARDL